MAKLPHDVALVTGAGSDIGKAIARLPGTEGAPVVHYFKTTCHLLAPREVAGRGAGGGR